MNLDQQQALAIAQARRRRAEAEARAPQTDAAAASDRPGGMEILNEGIVRSLGAPADFTTWLINSGAIDGINKLTGSDFGHITNPIGGSNSIRSAFETVGTDFAGEEFQPEGVVENLVMGTGSAAGGILPMVGVGKALQTAASPVAKTVGDTLTQPFATAPIRAVASEVAAGGGAGVGMEVADNLAPDNPMAQVAGALVGGGVAGAGPYVAGKTVSKLPLVSTAVRAVQNDLAPFSQAGAMERARRRMAGLVEDPEAAIAAVNTPTTGNLSPAVSTGERRMMALERVVRDQDPAVDMRMRQAEAEGNAALREAMLDPARPAARETYDLTNPISAQADGEILGVEIMRGADGRPEALYTEQGIVQVPEAFRDLSPEEIIIRQLGYDDGTSTIAARVGERGAPLGTQVGRSHMEGAVQQQIEGVGQALDDTFGAPVPTATATSNLRTSTAPARQAAYDAAYNADVNLYATDAGRQLEALVERVRHAAPGAFRRANQLMAGAGYESNQMLLQEAEDGTVTLMRLPDTRQLDFLTRSLRDMAGSTEGQGAFGGPNTYGNTLSDLSRQIRNNVRAANPAYGNALDTAATALGERDALRFGTDLLNPSVPRDVVAGQVADMTPAELNFARQAVRAQLDEQLANVRMTIANPDVGMREAQSAMLRLSSRAVREKINLLFPDEQAQALFDRMDSATAMLDPRRSGPALYASARPDEEIRAIMNSPNPRAAAQQIVEQASADPTGQALPSVKGSFIGELMSRSRTGSFDEAGEPVLSGRALRNALNDSRVDPVASTLLTQEERSRLATIADELAKVETANGRLPNVGGIMEGEPNSIISLIARTFAARTGAHAGKGTSGASLLTASWASKRMQDLLRKLTTDKAEGLIKQAITGDRELFEALLTPAERWTPETESRFYNVLSTTMQGTASAAIGQAGLGNSEDNEAEDPGTGDPVLDAIMRGQRPAGPNRTDLEFDSYIQNMK